MLIATWNVNSVRARQERLLAWLDKHRPDVLCLQELKVVEEAFPFDAVGEAGYHAAVYGQKTYNGVAILSREEPAGVRRGIDDGVDDPQARLIAAEVAGVHVINAYVPNGSQVGSEAFDYKLRWMRRLAACLGRHWSPGDAVVLCGDLNVAADDRDVAEPDEWADTVLCVPQVRRALERACRWGLVDVFRKHHPEGGVYSWWDYRMAAFPRNDGLRLDHVLATEALGRRCTRAEVDRDERKGHKPSDHAPVLAWFD